MKKFNARLRRPLSLNARVMLFVAVAITLSLFIIGNLIQSTVEHHFAEQDADELVVITRAVEFSLEKASAQGLAPRVLLSQAVSGHHGVYFQVWNESNQLIYGPSEVELSQQTSSYAPLAQIQAGNLYRWKFNGKTYRGAVTKTRIGDHTYRIVAAIDIDFHLHFLNSFGQSLWMIMLLAGVFTLLAARYGVHQGHAPLRNLSDAMRDIQADRLHLRLESETVPGELKTLVNSFNHMLSRLEESFARLTHFSADIAHELRTPLTNLITQTQVALGKQRSLDEYRELLYSNLEEQERLTKMVNDMLWLAQSERGLLKPVWQTLALKTETQTTIEFFEALAEEKNIELKIEGPTLSIVGDREMLRRALSNLLSNAIRHTSAGEKIQVSLGHLGEKHVFLRIENPGPDIPADHLSKLFDRFYRVDPSRLRQSDGAGLGLAITKSIIEAHGGKIEVTSNHGTTRFTILLPSAKIQFI